MTDPNPPEPLAPGPEPEPTDGGTTHDDPVPTEPTPPPVVLGGEDF
jgi:hypothetical protein